MADSVPSPMGDITLTFPDGASRKVKAGTTGLEVAKSISPSLAKRTVAMSSTARSPTSPIPSTKMPKSTSSPAPTRTRSS